MKKTPTSSPQPLGLTIVTDEPCKLLAGITRHLSQVVPDQTLLRLAKLPIAKLPQRGVYKGVASLGGFDRKLNDLGAR